MHAWADLYRCIVYIENVEIRGVCPAPEEDAFDAVVAVVAELTGVDRSVSYYIIKRIMEGLGREQLITTVEELAEAVAFLARSAELGWGKSNGPEEIAFPEREIGELDPVSHKEAWLAHGLV